MSVVAPFTRHYPLLLESDALSLSSDFKVHGHMLLDIPLQADHRLRDPAGKLVTILAEGCTFASLLRAACLHGVTDPQLCDLLGFLNITGALRCERTTRQRFKAYQIKIVHLVLGVSYRPLNWRQCATARTIAQGILRSTWPVTLSTVCVGILMIASGLALPIFVASISAFGLAVFLGSLFLHEVVHMYIAARHHSMPQVLQIGLRLGVVHRRLPVNAEILSSLMGPLTGAFVSIGIGAGMYLGGWTLHSLLGISIGCFHILSLIPWYGDGSSLYAAIRQQKQEKEL